MFRRESHLYAEAIEAKFNQESFTRHRYKVTVEEGRKFDKVYYQSWIPSDAHTNEQPRAQRCVLAFVEIETGKLIKPAGWSKPAKWGTDWASKFNLKDNLQEAVEASEFSGGFLYK